LPASRARGLDWQGAQAPSLAELEAIADQAFKRLPRRFRDLCAESDFDLLGLYHGVDLARQSVMDPAAMPEMVFLYRRPILDYWAEHEETLGAVVTHVLVHEIGHHFGLSDADMHRIEEEAAA
jgi:predicted Zn-dependent protease with MMP-like domain